MSYPYGGGPPGQYPGQAPYPTAQPGAYQQPSNYPQVQMPTANTAMNPGAYQLGGPGQAPGMPQPSLGFGQQPAPYGGAPQQPYGGQPPNQPYGAPLQQQPYGVPPQQPYGAPTQPAPYGAPAQQPYSTAPATVPYGGPPAAVPYGGAPQAPAPYPGAPQQQMPYGAAPSAPYGSQPGAVPAPASYAPATQQAYGMPPSTAPGYGGVQSSQPMPGQYGAPVNSAYAGSPAYASSVPPQNVGSQYSYEQRGDPTLRAIGNFNPENDCRILRQAMKGFGTDEKAIIDIIARRSVDQRLQIKNLYKTCFGKDLVQDLKSELSNRFEDVIVALMFTRDEFDAYELRRAMRGAGTDEACLVEILCTRNNQQIKSVAAVYRQMYNKNLEQDIVSDTSGHFKRLMVSMANAGRMENQQVNQSKAREDAQRLQAAGVSRWGTDESTFNSVLASQSLPQLRCVFDEYQKLTGKSMEHSIRSEMSGYLQEGMITIVKVVQDKAGFFADKLYSSMKGLGTDDRGLIRVVVTRSEVDMVQIKQSFQQKYGKTLGQFIKEDTTGDYRRVLTALIGE